MNSIQNFFKKNLHKIIILTYVFLAPISWLYADTNIKICDPADSSGKICNPVPYDTLSEFIRVILEGVLKIGIPIIALAIIYSGFLFVAAQGNSEKLSKAKQALLYTLIGAAILLGSWAIAKLISETVLAL